MLKNRMSLIFFILLILITVSSCKKEEKIETDVEATDNLTETEESESSEETDADTQESSETEEESTEGTSATNINPLTEKTGKGTTKPAEDKKSINFLTGEECTDEHQRQRPVAVMINNIKAALPNVGISYADIVYECIVEGGQTRLMMVLDDYEEVPVFGSVRSSRDYFVDLAQIHDAIYVHAGGTDAAYNVLQSRNIARLDGVNMYFPNTFFRDKERLKTKALEHTLMATGAGIKIGIGEQGYREKHKGEYNGTFNFYDKWTDITGEAATYVAVPYSASFTPYFKYNADEKKYYRWQFNEPHIDGGNNQQIAFENVIVLFAGYKLTGHVNGYLDCFFTGDGYGFYITNGKYKVIKWHKDTRESILNLRELDDSALTINPGKSFICITSTTYNKSVVIKGDE